VGWRTTLLATDDSGALQGPDAAGMLEVGPFRTLLPLLAMPR
jgi:hypothetical protein